VKRLLLLTVLAFATVVLTLPAHADPAEFKRTLKEAVEAFDRGDYEGAIQSLDFAKGIARNAQSGQINEAFPKDMLGYKSEQSQGNAGMGMLGGANVSRTYKKGNKRIEITISTNRMLVQAMGMAMNPMMLGQDPNAKLVRIKGKYKAVQKFDPGSNKAEITAVLRNTLSVQGVGRNQDSPDDTMKFMEAVGYDVLNDFMDRQ